MGEYARYNGGQIKIGTCEDMYYLRADQRHRVGALSGNVDPVKDAKEIRFRFPFPDEDGTEPGAFDKYDRGLALWAMKSPLEVEHGKVPFSASVGYLVSLPCPEGPGGSELATLFGGVHRNGFQGPVRLVQQRLLADGVTWAAILACGGCDYRWRCETREEALEVVAACEDEAAKAAQRERDDPRAGDYWREVGRRVLAGYDKAPQAGRVAS